LTASDALSRRRARCRRASSNEGGGWSARLPSRRSDDRARWRYLRRHRFLPSKKGRVPSTRCLVLHCAVPPPRREDVRLTLTGQRRRARVKFEALRSANSQDASRLPPTASTSNRNLLMLKIARLRPEKITDWVMQRAIPIQTKTFANKGKYHGADAIQLNPNRRINHVFTKCVRMT
jgi:hypothetical protein